MRAGLQKLGRWTAGRLQGSKGVQKYDKYMEESPFARGLLTMGDLALATAGGAALAGSGAGAGVKGLLMGGKVAAPNIGGTAMLSPGVAGQTLASVAPAASAATKSAGLLKGIGSAAKTAGSFAKENKDLLTMAGKGIQMALPKAPSATEEAEIAFTNERIREMQDERERRRRIAELLMPYAQQNFPQYFGNR